MSTAWAYVALIGGSAYVDAGGREAVKVLGLRNHGVRVGTAAEFRLAMATFAVLILIGGIVIATGLVEVV